MELTVNGQKQEVGEAVSVADLLRQLQVRTERVAVEVNRQVVPRGEHTRRRLQPGDEVELVTFVGGG